MILSILCQNIIINCKSKSISKCNAIVIKINLKTKDFSLLIKFLTIAITKTAELSNQAFNNSNNPLALNPKEIYKN